jgi:class 3 adenylate cyclase
VQICPSCGEENSERARFCQACAAPLGVAAEPALERKVVTVLFVDLVDFTARAERLDPEDVQALLARYHDRVRAEIERFGGLVEKFVGDAVVGIFGAPAAHGDDPERGVRAAFAVRDALDELNEAEPGLDLRARFAINTGEALVSLGANPAKGEAMVAGDVINTAARLQAAAPVQGILVGEETYASTRVVIDYRRAEPVAAKGKAHPVPAWAAVGVLAPVGQRSFSGVALIGRGTELGVLRGIWEGTVDESRPHLVTVFGSTGVGKSRLAYELGQRVEATGGRVLLGRSVAYGESGPYGAFAQQVKQIARIFDNDPLTSSRERLREAIAELSGQDDAGETVRHLCLLVGLGSEGSAPDQETIFYAARLLVEGVAARQPAMLVFEDIHWSDPSLLDLIEFLAGRACDVPLLILTLARPELLATRPSWAGGLPAYTALRLEPLSDHDAVELSRRLLSRAPADDGAGDDDGAARIAATAEGNPLFIEELAASLSERATPGGAQMPTSIRGIVGARLDALPTGERDVLLDAAVAGKVFWRGLLVALRPDRQDLSDLLGRLEQRDLIRRDRASRIQGERQYTFKHQLIRDVAYQTLPRAERQRRHAATARFLEGAAPEIGDSVAALAHHWREAGDHERAIRYLLAAAEQAGQGWAKARARELYREAFALVPAEDLDLRRDVARRLAVAEAAAWHLPDVERMRGRGEGGG